MPLPATFFSGFPAAAGGVAAAGGPSTALLIAGTQLGLNLLNAAFDRRPSIRLHQQQHRPMVGPFAPVQSPEGPIPLVWGQHDRYAPKLVYAQKTQYEIDVRGQNDGPGEKTQPATGNRAHLVYGISWGEIEAVDGIWIDGTFVDITGQTPGDDGEGPKFDLTGQKGRGRLYLDPTAAARFGAVRRNTLPLANSLDPHTGQLVDLNWKDTDTMAGWACMYLQFDADPQDVTLEPTTPLDSWPAIEISVRGRKVLIPDSADASTWSMGYSDSATAIAYDMLSLAGHADMVNARDTWDSHRVCSIMVEVELAADGSMPFFLTAPTKPNKPTAFNATSQGWVTTAPTDDPPAGSVHWWTLRSGTSSSFEFTDVLPFRTGGGDPGGPDNPIGTEDFSMVTSAYGVDVNIDEPMIDLENDDELKKIVIPPGSPTLPPGGATPDYRGRYMPQQTGILYPANVLMGSDEFTERGLADALRRLEFVMQGRIVRDRGQLRILAGWQREVIGTVTDGLDCEVTGFRSADSADRQWNVITMGLPNGGPNGTETEAVEVADDALIARTGRSVLRMGQQPFVADTSHARRLAVTSLVRRRHQRQGVLTLPPDSPLLEDARSGARISIKSKRLQLESYRLNDMRQVVATDFTTFVMLGAATNPDGSVSAPIEEDPDENWRVYTALPNLDPDVSEPGVLVPAVANLSLSDRAYQADGQAWQTELVAMCDPAAVQDTNFRSRLTVASGDTVTEMVDGAEVERVGPYTGEWELLSAGHGNFMVAIRGVRIGLTYEVQAQHVGESRAGAWSSSALHTVGTLPDLPTGGQVPWEAEIVRPMRASSATAADTASEWFLTGSAGGWDGQRVLVIGGVTETEEALLNRLTVDSLVSVYDDDDNWLLAKVDIAATFSGSGTTRTASVTVTWVQSKGSQPSSGPIRVRFFPSGLDGVDLMDITSYELSTIDGWSMTWNTVDTAPDLWRVHAGHPTATGGIRWQPFYILIDGHLTEYTDSTGPLIQTLQNIYNNPNIDNTIYIRCQGVRRDGSSLIGYGATAAGAVIQGGGFGLPVPTLTPGDGEVQIALSEVAGATAYDIQRAIDDQGTGATIVSADNTTRMYTDDTVTNGMAYYYRARAKTDDSIGAWSGWVMTTPNMGALGTPVLSFTPSPGQVAISWPAITNATRYDLQRATDAMGTGETTISADNTTRMYTDTGLTNGTTYYYRARAENATDMGGWSAWVGSTPTTLNTPALTVSGQHNEVAINIGEVAGATGYDVERAIDDMGSFNTLILSNVDAGDHTDTAVLNDTTYWYRVRSKQGGTNGAWSDPWISATPMDTGTAPAFASASTSITATAGTVSTITLPAATGDPEPTYTISGDYSWLSLSGRTLTVGSAAPVDTYTLTYTATNQSGSATLTVTLTVQPAAPADFALTLSVQSSNLRDYQVTFDWPDVTGATDYTLVYQVSGIGFQEPEVTRTLTTSILGLHRNRAFADRDEVWSVRVTVNGGNNDGDEAAGSITVTPDDP